MRRKISEALPGFVGLNDFFGLLGREFVPRRATHEEKLRYIEAIGQIHGFPSKWLDPEIDAFKDTAQVREVRQYAKGLMMVRFEVMRRSWRESEKYESPSINLMLALNRQNEMAAYTLIYGTGRHTHGFSGWVCRQHIKPTVDIPFTSASEMMMLVEQMKQSDFIIIEESGQKRQFIQAYCDEDEDERCKNDPLFTFEYCIHDWIWQFVLSRRVRRSGLKRLLRIYQEGGIPALQSATKWRQMNITAKNLAMD